MKADIKNAVKLYKLEFCGKKLENYKKTIKSDKSHCFTRKSILTKKRQLKIQSVPVNRFENLFSISIKINNVICT